MIDPLRRELLKLVEELSTACPEYRFGQMILNLAFLAREDGDRFVWDMEDTELIEAARKHLADWHARRDESQEIVPSEVPSAPDTFPSQTIRSAVRIGGGSNPL